MSLKGTEMNFKSYSEIIEEAKKAEKQRKKEKRKKFWQKFLFWKR